MPEALRQGVRWPRARTPQLCSDSIVLASLHVPHEKMTSFRKGKRHININKFFPVTAWVGGSLPTGWPGVSRPTGGQGSKVYVLCAVPKECKHVRPGTRPGGSGSPAGRIGDRGWPRNCLCAKCLCAFSGPYSETGRIRFRGVRFRTPNSVSFLGLTEFRGANSASSSQPIICVPKRTHRVFRRTHRVCPRTQWGSLSSLLRNSTLETVFRLFPTYSCKKDETILK